VRSRDALTDAQRQALKLLDRGGFVKTSAGWHPPENDGVNAFNGQTLQALARRAWYVSSFAEDVPPRPTLPPKGRCVLALVRKPAQPEMALP
jgi:hypothetical protein